jgi:hypothetical protein
MMERRSLCELQARKLLGGDDFECDAAGGKGGLTKCKVSSRAVGRKRRGELEWQQRGQGPDDE